MRPFLAAYAAALQELLQHRWTLAMDRLRGLALILSLYYFWSALLPSGDGRFLGYDRAQMVTYVLGMSLMRSLALSGRVWDIMFDISQGRLSSLLLKPMHPFAYYLARECALKTLLAGAALLEIGVLAFVLRAPLHVPASPLTVLAFLGSALLAMALYYELALLVSSSAFWTSESTGPIFAFDLFLYFAAGAFFPLDVLPAALQEGLTWTPFPYLVYHPLQVWLGRETDWVRPLLVLGFWLAALGVLLRAAWNAGTRDYAAEGG